MKNRSHAASVIITLLAISFLPAKGDRAENLLFYAYGVRAERDKNWQQALKFYKKAEKGNYESFLLCKKIVKGHLRQKNKEKAQEALNSFVEKFPKHYQAQVYYADFLRKHYSSKKTADYLRELINRFPDKSQLITRYISATEDAERRKDSLNALEKALQSNSKDYKYWLALLPIVQTLYSGGTQKLHKAEELTYKRIGETGLTEPQVVRRLLRYYHKKKDTPKAISILEKHLELQPTSYQLKARLGILYLSAGKEKLALKTLQESLDISSEQILPHSALAKYYGGKKNVEKALFHQAELLRIRGGSMREFLELAQKLQENNKYDTLVRLLRPLSYKYPKEPQITAYIALAAWKDGASELAKNYFSLTSRLQKAKGQTHPNKMAGYNFYLARSEMHLANKNLDEAEEDLRKAIKIISGKEKEVSSRAYTMLAKLWLKQNKNRDSIRPLLERALSLNSENQVAKKLRKEHFNAP